MLLRSINQQRSAALEPKNTRLRLAGGHSGDEVEVEQTFLQQEKMQEQPKLQAESTEEDGHRCNQRRAASERMRSKVSSGAALTRLVWEPHVRARVPFISRLRLLQRQEQAFFSCGRAASSRRD